MGEMTEDDYISASCGFFSGILKWQAFEALWTHLKTHPDEWYVYTPGTGDAAPTEPMTSDEFLSFLSEAESLLRDKGDPRSCGTVYVDDREGPKFVKIFHPQKMGTSCSVPGAEHAKIWPWWTISKAAPVRVFNSEAARELSIFDRIMGRR